MPGLGRNGYLGALEPLTPDRWQVDAVEPSGAVGLHGREHRRRAQAPRHAGFDSRVRTHVRRAGPENLEEEGAAVVRPVGFGADALEPGHELLPPDGRELGARRTREV